MPLMQTGRYELVYVVPSDLQRAALAFTPDAVHRPADAGRHLIGSFVVPRR
jgi:hypothetical protein